MPDLTELQRLAEGATPGPWLMNTEAEYCGARIDGPDGRSIGHAIQRNPHPTLGQGITQEEAIANARLIAAMSPDTAKKLIAVARAGLSAHREIQRFKMRWLNLPTFADKLNKTTRQAMTMAHQPIMMAEEVLRAALEELK